MQKFSLEINKTIKKKGVRSKQKDDILHHNPAILRSKSLPNNSEINFETETISTIFIPENGIKINDDTQYSPNLLPSDKGIEYIQNTYISTKIINQIINHVNNPDIMSLTGVPPDPDND